MKLLPKTIGSLIISAGYWLSGTTVTTIEAEGGLTILDTGILGLSGTATSYAVGAIALEGISIGAEQLLQPSLKITSQKQNVKLAISPRRSGYGRTRIGAVVDLIKRSEATGDGILYVVPMLISRKIDAFEEHRFGDQIVRIDETGTRVPPPGAAVYPARFLDGQRVTIHTYTGDSSQSADSLLLSAFPGYWTSQHHLDGIAYSVLKLNGVALTDFGEVYSGVPSYTAQVRLAKVWDPRDSAQDADDSTTWLWTENAALIIMDYLSNADGMRLPRDMIELAIDDWIIAADTCDEQVDLISGDTEARYRLAGVYEFTDEPKNVLGSMLSAIDGRLRLREDGAIVLDVGAFESPTIAETFGEDDILQYGDFGHGTEKTALKNEIRATYLSAAHDYQSQEADPYRNEDSILVDGLQTTTLSLDWCPSHRQARHLMKVSLKRLNPEWSGTIVTNARGLNLLGKRYAHFTIPDLGLDHDCWIKPGSQFDLLNGRCTFQVASFSATDYDFDDTTEGGVSPENAKPGNHGILVPTDELGNAPTSLTITADGAGGGGSDRGAGAGARSVKTIAIDPADVGTRILFTVGLAGIGEAVNVIGGVMTDGGDSTVTGTLTAGPIAMVAGGGKKGTNSPGAGGVATGGDTNTNGGGGSGPDGGTAASGAPPNEAYGGGGDIQTDGGDGFVDFQWTFP